MKLGQQIAGDVPALILSLKAASKIFAYTDISPFEINGWGLVEQYDGDDDFYVSDVFILPQVASDSEVEGVPDALMKFPGDCPTPEKMKFQWHSHGSTVVYYSPTDLEGIDDYGCSADYILSMVVNKDQNCICRLDLFSPFRMTLSIPVFMLVPIAEETRNSCQAEFDTKVTVRKSIFFRDLKNQIEGIDYLFLPLSKNSDKQRGKE